LTHGVGILGGTFDPIHYGHLRMADNVCAALDLAAVRLIPAGNPYHRPASDRPAPRLDRLAMAELGVGEFPRLAVDPREAASNAPSYTVHTLASLRPELGAAPILLLLGADAFLTLPGWKEWERLFELAHLVLIARPGFAMPEPLPAPLADHWRRRLIGDPRLLTSGSGRIYRQEVVPQPISATAIRAMIRGGQRPEGLTPPAVIDYIETHHLYRR
jgi:nicotinate-nucleotide adenylyltransferase